MSNVLEHHLRKALDGIPGVSIVVIGGVVGLLVESKLYVKFNKMDNKHNPSIQRRKWYKAITDQGQEIEGLPKAVVKMWAGIVPLDKPWSDVARCSLVYYEGGTVAWYSNLVDGDVRQMRIDMKPMEQKRRTKPKKKDGEGDANTGTDNS